MQRVFSGIQPSGTITIGNYLGAIRNFVQLQHTAECLFCVVDMHAITVPQDPQQLYQRTRELAALYLACGIDPQKAILFVQSHVPAHAELGWLLQCMIYYGELGRMTQFKDKSEQKDVVTAGLFTYPALMAADILLYQTTLVPVGEDQKQHLELTRDVAIRFNRRYGETFIVPEAMIPKMGGRIMSLENPLKKMSKSDESPNATLYLLDPPEVLRKKISRAVTDSGREVRYNEEEKPAVSNLMTIYALCTGKSLQEVEEEFAGQGYGPFKQAIADAVVSVFEPIQQCYHEWLESPDLEKTLADGAEKAEKLASVTLEQVKEQIGFLPRRA